MDTNNPGGQEHLSPDASPFSESAEKKPFFPGGGRQTVLDEMVLALTGGIPIVTLAGAEGSGKTAICRLLKQRMTSGYAVVFFPRIVESFDEVLRASVQELGFASDSLPTDTSGLLQVIVSHLHTHDLRLLLIIDEAERIYLATLERVRKLLDLANHTGVFVQMVLSGTMELHHNFKNLALCNFQQAEEKHLSLQSLTEDETYAYLTCMMGEDGEKSRSIFTREMASLIFSSSNGNLRLINEMADEALKKPEADASSMGIEDTVQDNGQRKTPSRRRLKQSIGFQPFSFNRRYAAWGGCAVAILVVILLLVYGSREKTSEPMKETELVEAGAPSADIAGSAQPVSDKESESHEPAENAPVAAPPQQAKTALPSDNELVAQEDNETTALSSPQPSAVVVPTPPEPAAVKALPERKEDKIPTTPVVAKETGREDAKEAAASSGEEQQDIESEAEVVVTGGRVDPQPPGEQVQPAPATDAQEVAGEDAAEIAGAKISSAPAGEPTSVVATEQKKAQNVAIPIAGRPVTPSPDNEDDSRAAEPQPISTPPQQQAVDAGPPPVGFGAEQAIPQVIAAREVVKHREQIAPAIPETISTGAVKIVRKEEVKPAAAPTPPLPLEIKAEEQKKEPVSQSAGPVVQPAPSEEQGKAAPRVIEAPKKAEGVDHLYSRRLAAGTSWFLGNKNDHYTVRLMVITSGNAEKKLKSMLGEKRYREQADKFYILRKESNPDVQYVYYGEYPTMTAARNARNTIPEFLRGYKPYAMSVKGAVQRAQQDE